MGARRQMWEVIQQVAEHCSVVLTTHHLEEIEALASRTGIMVDGKMRCIGSLQHLKSKFGSGFEMSLRVRGADYTGAARGEADVAAPARHEAVAGVQHGRGEQAGARDHRLQRVADVTRVRLPAHQRGGRPRTGVVNPRQTKQESPGHCRGKRPAWLWRSNVTTVCSFPFCVSFKRASNQLDRYHTGVTASPPPSRARFN